MDETELVKKAQSGNKEAMAQLLYSNYEIVFKYLIKFTLNKTVAEDITQETMVKAIEKFNKYNAEKSKLSTWLITIAQNIYLDQIRKNKNQKKYLVEIDTIEELAEDPVEYDDTCEKMQEALTKLKEEVRIPIILKHYYGYSYEEIAEKMKIMTGTVKSRIHNGLKVLKKELKLYE